MSKWTRPWLNRFHRNFFIIYVVTIIFNFWAALNGVMGNDAWFQLSVLEYVNHLSHEWWGLAYLGVGITLFVGFVQVKLQVGKNRIGCRIVHCCV